MPNKSLDAASLNDIALVQSEQGREAYVISNGNRHYIPEVSRLAQYGLRWPEDIIQVSDALLRATRVAGWLPQYFENDVKADSINTSATMREYMAAGLSGTGLEVGAGASPFPVPLRCRTLYGDHVTYEQLESNLYPGQTDFQLVRPDLKTDFVEFNGIADESLDFIIGCHVIEHVFNPIGTLVNAYRKLRKGGQLLLVVPDKERTFDRDRPLTTLEHLILDYESPDDQRDRMHYEEFYRLAFKVEGKEFSKKVAKESEKRGDLHAHVWNYEQFEQLINYVNDEIVCWSNIRSNRPLPDEKNDIEFYYRLVK